MTRRRLLLPAMAIALGALFAVACGGDDDDPGSGTTPAVASTAARTPSSVTPAERTPAKKATLRLGYFPNVTHAQALIGVKDGWFAKELGDNVRLETKTFNAGPAAIEAMFAGAIDATFIGPNPAINGFVQSDGKELRIVSGAASAGALFVVRSDANITGPRDLAGKKFATPQLGNTQDVALRAYVKAAGLKTKDEGGNVTILPTANADALALFRKGDIDGAWVPEPWASRFILEAGAKVFIDEKTLWPDGRFVTTHLIVRTKFLAENPEVVEALIRANVKITEWINQNAEDAKRATNEAIGQITSAKLSQEVIDAAWKNLEFTWDPIAGSLRRSADDAYALGFLQKKPDLAKIYDLALLNRVLAARNLPPANQ